MLRAAAQQLARGCSSSTAAAAATGAPAALQAGLPAMTLSVLRRFSSSDSPSSSEGTSVAAPGAQPSSPQGAQQRAGTKQWRSWIDSKLDSKLEDLQQQQQQQQQPAEAAPVAAAPPRRPPPPTAPRAKGFELEQQIYSIVSPARGAQEEEGTLPEGVTTYAQLAMAGDAPRFAYSAANVADVSPQRLHPTRLFFPRNTYGPADLDPYKGSTSPDSPYQPAEGVPVATPDEVTRLADYKNAPLLAAFLSDAGKLPLRKRTQLRAKLHRHLVRQIKLARQLAILSPTERWRPQTAAEAAAEAAEEARERKLQQAAAFQQQQQQKKKKQQPKAQQKKQQKAKA